MELKNNRNEVKIKIKKLKNIITRIYSNKNNKTDLSKTWAVIY